MVGRRSRMNLRTLSTATFVFFGALVLADESALALEHDIRAVDATAEIEHAAREHHRLGLALASTREPELEAARSELFSSSKTSLTSLWAHVGNDEDRRLLGLLEAQFSAYERTA